MGNACYLPGEYPCSCMDRAQGYRALVEAPEGGAARYTIAILEGICAGAFVAPCGALKLCKAVRRAKL